MPDLPRTIDVRDDLRRARETSDRDVEDDVAAVRSTLDRFADPDQPDREGLLEDVENTLLRLEERETDETATRRFEAARNRVEQFRTAVANSSDDLVVVHSELKSRDDDAESGVGHLRGEFAEVLVTVANIGEAVDSQVEVTFFDDDRNVLDVVTTRVDLGASEEETVPLDVEIPDETADYAVTAGPAEL